jgi:hypothetical protein
VIDLDIHALRLVGDVTAAGVYDADTRIGRVLMRLACYDERLAGVWPCGVLLRAGYEPEIIGPDGKRIKMDRKRASRRWADGAEPDAETMRAVTYRCALQHVIKRARVASSLSGERNGWVRYGRPDFRGLVEAWEDEVGPEWHERDGEEYLGNADSLREYVELHGRPEVIVIRRDVRSEDAEAVPVVRRPMRRRTA